MPVFDCVKEHFKLAKKVDELEEKIQTLEKEGLVGPPGPSSDYSHRELEFASTLHKIPISIPTASFPESTPQQDISNDENSIITTILSLFITYHDVIYICGDDNRLTRALDAYYELFPEETKIAVGWQLCIYQANPDNINENVAQSAIHWMTNTFEMKSPFVVNTLIGCLLGPDIIVRDRVASELADQLGKDAIPYLKVLKYYEELIEGSALFIKDIEDLIESVSQ